MGCLLCPKRPVIFDILFFFSTFVVSGYADAFVRSGGYSTDRDTDVIHIHSWLGEYLTLITRKNKIELYIAISLSVNWHRQQWLPIDEVLLLSSKYFPGQFFYILQHFLTFSCISELTFPIRRRMLMFTRSSFLAVSLSWKKNTRS